MGTVMHSVAKTQSVNAQTMSNIRHFRAATRPVRHLAKPQLESTSRFWSSRHDRAPEYSSLIGRMTFGTIFAFLTVPTRTAPGVQHALFTDRIHSSTLLRKKRKRMVGTKSNKQL